MLPGSAGAQMCPISGEQGCSSSSDLKGELAGRVTPGLEVPACIRRGCGGASVGGVTFNKSQMLGPGALGNGTQRRCGEPGLKCRAPWSKGLQGDCKGIPLASPAGGGCNGTGAGPGQHPELDTPC